MSENLVQTPTLFDRFGGIAKLAEGLGEPKTTVSSWKQAGRIPAQRQPRVLELAEAIGVEITAEDVVFPMGRPNTPLNSSASATKLTENIRESVNGRSDGAAEAGAPSPFSEGSCAICSPTSARSSTPAGSPGCSTGEAKAA
jgi:hypothetical protein